MLGVWFGVVRGVVKGVVSGVEFVVGGAGVGVGFGRGVGDVGVVGVELLAVAILGIMPEFGIFSGLESSCCLASFQASMYFWASCGPAPKVSCIHLLKASSPFLLPSPGIS